MEYFRRTNSERTYTKSAASLLDDDIAACYTDREKSRVHFLRVGFFFVAPSSPHSLTRNLVIQLHVLCALEHWVAAVMMHEVHPGLDSNMDCTVSHNVLAAPDPASSPPPIQCVWIARTQTFRTFMSRLFSSSWCSILCTWSQRTRESGVAIVRHPTTIYRRPFWSARGSVLCIMCIIPIYRWICMFRRPTQKLFDAAQRSTETMESVLGKCWGIVGALY